MFPIRIRCDHRRFKFWPWQCHETAVKHLLHHGSTFYGKDPQVLLLCAPHFDHHVKRAKRKVEKSCRNGVPMVLSGVVKDTGKI